MQTTAAASDGRPAGRDAPPRPAGRPATRPATPKNGPAASRKPAGRPAGRPAKTGWPTGWPAGRPTALTTLWNVRAARNRAQGSYFCPFFLRTAGKMHFSYRPVARRSPHHLASAPGRPLKPTTYRTPVPIIVPLDDLFDCIAAPLSPPQPQPPPAVAAPTDPTAAFFDQPGLLTIAFADWAPPPQPISLFGPHQRHIRLASAICSCTHAVLQDRATGSRLRSSVHVSLYSFVSVLSSWRWTSYLLASSGQQSLPRHC